MKYYSTNGQAPIADLEKAVVKGLAEDRGLYMPEEIYKLPQAFFDDIQNMKFQDIAYNVASNFFGDDVDGDALQDLVYDTLSFDCPVVKVTDQIYALELFHGPTLAFKDVGARFMARLLRYFTSSTSSTNNLINVLVATSGDTGSAVANGFLGVEGIHVYVLYPKGKVSPIQECQFTTLGKNITAIEVDGVFDDCQALVKSAFMDQELNEHMKLTSANSINVARFLPQAFYYFNAYARMKALGLADQLVMCVPSGNFGNICSALFGHQMGLPIKRFIAANNANDIFYKYLQTGKYEPRASVQTLANAMDVGDPSKGTVNGFRRYFNSDGVMEIADHFGEGFFDAALAGYVLDPHGACGYQALKDGLKPGEIGVFCETAHPAKFKEKVDDILGTDIEIPARLKAFMEGQKQSVGMSKEFAEFKAYLMKQ